MGIREVCLRWLPVSFLFMHLTTPAQGQSVVYRPVHVGRVKAHVITVNLKTHRLNLGLYVPSRQPRNGNFPHESFRAMIARTRPTAAIDGTYYDTRTYRPVGTLVLYGQMLQAGSYGTAVCFDQSNRVSFYKLRDLKNFPWNRFKIIISTGPTLVVRGHMHVYPRSERFRDPGLFRRASRSALGVTPGGKLLLVAVRKPILLRDMAWIMKKLGAFRAVALDGGSSTALYYRGRFVVRPDRPLTNILVVYEEKEARVSKE